MLESIKGTVLRASAARLEKADHPYYADKLNSYAQKADDFLAIGLGTAIGYVAHIIYRVVVG